MNLIKKLPMLLKWDGLKLKSPLTRLLFWIKKEMRKKFLLIEMMDADHKPPWKVLPN